MKKKITTAALVALLGISLSAMADDMLDTLSNDGGFKILLSAIKTAGMESAFNAAGPITVFAPTDFAFQAMPKEKLDALLASKDSLTKFLSLHVVPKKITAEDVSAKKVKTMEGSDVTLAVEGGVKINGIAVVGQSIHADNGNIYPLTAVLMSKP